MDLTQVIQLLMAVGGGSLAVGVSAYMVARRQNSGRVETSDAATLWAESQAMRKELRDEVASLRREVSEMAAEIRGLRSEIRILRQRLAVYEAIIVPSAEEGD